MTSLNLGILAHVDAGKTTLTEHLLHRAGVLDHPGSVDDGSTTTDDLDLERRRGITIRSAVASFRVDGTVVNLLDTPGHPDFVAEVERTLDVLDGAVLVVSAVEGVQPQTRVLARALDRLGVPVLVFVNKLDRAGADRDRVAADLRRRLYPGLARTWDREDVLDVLTRRDEPLLAQWVERPGSVDAARVRTALAAATARREVVPALSGSAARGDGVAELLRAVVDLLPARSPDPDSPVAGQVFTVARDAHGRRRAWVDLRAGTLRVREPVDVDGTSAKVTALGLCGAGHVETVTEVRAGRIATVEGLATVRVGDAVGAGRPGRRHFPAPTLEVTIEPEDPDDRGPLHAALERLAEQDPLIGLRHDDVRGETTLALYGEVQREVVQAMLSDEHGIATVLGPTSVVCIEELLGTGAAEAVIATPPNPFLATVGLRVDRAPAGSGVTFGLEVELGSMPAAFFTAVEESVRSTLGSGPHGWAVRDCRVTMTRSGYWARQSTAHGGFDTSMSSTARDFRHLTPLVLAEAVRSAGTRVLEPVERFGLEVPLTALETVLRAVARLGGVAEAPRVDDDEAVLTGHLPAAAVVGLRRDLPSLTGGTGVLTTAPGHHVPVRGEPPVRPRALPDPWHRESYLLEVERRVRT